MSGHVYALITGIGGFVTGFVIGTERMIWRVRHGKGDA